MSDLIRRSELISHIEREYREYGEDYDVEQILGDIEDMPTAYDIDKVVEELEKESYAIMLDGALVASKEVVIDAKRATEIVKQGGKEILQ